MIWGTTCTLPDCNTNNLDALCCLEDALRDHESRQDFDESFIALARSVYQLNDRRSMAKRAINELLDVAQDEWKSYGG